MRLSRWWKRVGPGWLVTAAFVGPGTVTTASQSGAWTGLDLAWAIAFAILAAFVLQEMAARLGLVTRRDLGDILVHGFESRSAKFFAVLLILGAILVGNAAYQAGNLSGASAGLAQLTGLSPAVWTPALGLAAAVLIWFSVYRTIQAVLIVLVALMSLLFLATAIQTWPLIASPSPAARPEIRPGSSTTLILALIGTTVVPYNLFLHAAAVRERWQSPDLDENLRASRWDTAVAITVGGLVTFAILLTSAAVFYFQGQRWENVTDLAAQLRPLAGARAEWLFAAGLAAAGLTSAITAPLAAGLAASGCLGWRASWKDDRFRLTACGIILVGIVTNLAFGQTPLALILFAQACNGILLPLVAVYLLIAMNRPAILGIHVNTWKSNLLAGLVLLIVTALGVSTLLRVAAKLFP